MRVTDATRYPAGRAPLFAPALAVVAGCALGVSLPLPLLPLGLAVLVALGLWLSARNRPGLSAAACLLALVAGSAFHARLALRPGPGDLRALPEAKFDLPTWEGKIADFPRYSPSPRDAASGHVRFVLAVEHWKPGPTREWEPARGKVSVTVEQTGDTWRIGQHVRIAGPLTVPSGPFGPGQFDDRSYLASRRVYYELRAFAPDAQRLDSPAIWAEKVGEWSEAVRRWGVARLDLGVEGDPLAGPVAAAFVFGRKDRVPPLVLDHFRATGTYHLFSVSGGNMAVLLSLALAGLRLGGAIRWRWGWLVAPLLFFYALASGGQAGVSRALVSSAIVLCAWSIGRPVSALNLWSLTVLAVLALLPEAVRDMGFQFSFAVVLGLIVLTPPIARLLGAPLALDPFIPLRFATARQQAQSHLNLLLSGLLAGCAAAWIASTALELFYFHQLCLVSPLANLVAVPLAWLVFLVALLSLLGGLAWSGFAVLFNNANWVLVKVLVALVTLLARVPHASVYCGPPGFSDAEPQFVLLSAGHGTAVFVKHRGRAWLLNPLDEHTFLYAVQPARKYLGISRFDGVILTQWSAAQSAAASLVPQVMPPAPFDAPPRGSGSRATGAWSRPFSDGTLQVETWAAGETHELSPGLEATVLSPVATMESGNAADRGLVLRFDYGTARLLYAGGIGFLVEERLRGEGADARAAVLVESQPPGARNLLPAWLGAVAPRDVVVLGQRTAPGMTPDLGADLPEEERPRIWNLEAGSCVVVTLHADGTATVRAWAADEGKK